MYCQPQVKVAVVGKGVSSQPHTFQSLGIHHHFREGNTAQVYNFAKSGGGIGEGGSNKFHRWTHGKRQALPPGARRLWWWHRKLSESYLFSRRQIFLSGEVSKIRSEEWKHMSSAPLTDQKENSSHGALVLGCHLRLYVVTCCCFLNCVESVQVSIESALKVVG